MRNVLVGVLASVLVVATAVKMRGQQGGRGGNSHGADNGEGSKIQIGYSSRPCRWI